MSPPDDDDWEGWIVARSNIHDRTWVPYPSGFGDQSHFLCAGPLRAVKAYVEQEGPGGTWRRVDLDHFAYDLPEQ